MNLTLDERTKIFDKVCRLVETKHFNPAMNGVDWNALAQSRRDQILACTEAEAFEKEVQNLVAELKTSHTGFDTPGRETYRRGTRSMPPCSASPSMAMNAGCFRMCTKAAQHTRQGYGLGICCWSAVDGRFGLRRI